MGFLSPGGAVSGILGAAGSIRSAGGCYEGIIFVAKYGPAQTPLWTARFGDGLQDQFAEDVTTDAWGNVLLVGRIRGTVDFGCGPLTSTGAKYDVTVAKLNASGQCLWSHAYGNGIDDQFGVGVAVDGSGNAVIVGRMRGTVSFGGASLTSVGAKYDVFVAKLDANGAHLWSHSFGDGTQDQYGEAVAVDATGNVLLTGQMRGSINFGGGTMPSLGPHYDVFLAKLTGNGAHLWSAVYGDGVNDQAATGVAVDTAGNVVVTGTCRGSLSFGSPLTSHDPTKNDLFVAKFDGAGGHLWARALGDGLYDQQSSDVAVDGAGNIAVVGALRGTIDVGGTWLTSVGAKYDVFQAKLASDGTPLCSALHGDGVSDQRASGVAVGSTGQRVTTGQMRGTVDFGGGNLTSGSFYGVFLAQYGP